MYKFIIGCLVGAVVVAISCSGKLDESVSQKDSFKRKYEEEKQRRRDSDNTADKYKEETSKLKEELALERNRKYTSSATQKTKSVPVKKDVPIIKPLVIDKKNTAIKTEEKPVRYIRL